MFTVRGARISLFLLLLVAARQNVCRGQLSFHTDASTNSFTLKTPELQQSFTRYYGAAKTQPQVVADATETQDVQDLQQPQSLPSFGGFASAGAQYPGGYHSPSATSVPSKLKSSPPQLQQPLLSPTAVTTLPGGVLNMPSYADQMHAAFMDYQRQRAEFEQQQQHLLQNLYHYYPDVSGSIGPQPIHVQSSESGSRAPTLSLPRAQSQLQLQAPAAPGASVPSTGSRHAYGRPQFANNGLQPGAAGAGQGFGVATGPRSGLGAGPVPISNTLRSGDFYSTQQHMGFMQQQQQDVLRDQQQSVAHQFATSQLAPTTRQSFGMAVPMSSVLRMPSAGFQPSSDVSHVSFSSGNLNYSF
ncbi:hypothetical protein KR018_008307 [Drosophila ironensis]|nr:hypothetical protein KR018_008307 [Drosophila ironensis]